MTQTDIIKNLFDEKGCSPSKTADFLYRKVDKMNEKEQNSFYANLGMTYTQMQMQARARAEEKAKANG